MSGMKERMAHNRKSPEIEGEEIEGGEMPIEGTLSSMTSEMVDSLGNGQMRTLLKQAINYFQSDKD